ncbi:hypothetical protein [Actinomadura madurae]|uniref:hypothetical protein n=1 Tax=Actinomadura madurae TaxID=1993 RepID=UPI0020D25F0A|nr:hypothetical protein [Actinomadura madurae]MCQ0006971.1 hypothetical protein [Actinomadura madurae]
MLVLLVVGPLAGPGRRPVRRDAAHRGARGRQHAVLPALPGLPDRRRPADRPPRGRRGPRRVPAALGEPAGPGGAPRGAAGGRVVATLDTALSVGEALGPIIAALLWDVWGLAAFLLVRAGLGIATELVVSRRLRHTAL